MSPDAKRRILVVDDEVDMLETCRRILALKGYEVDVASRAEDAVARLEAGPFDLVVADLKMPRLTGIELLERVRRIDAALPVVLMTGFPTVETAIDAIKKGAYDYLTKPFTPDQLTVAVDRAVEKRNLQSQNAFLRRQLQDHSARFDEIVGQSPPLLQMLEQVRRAAPTEANVLVTGDSGTGKELVARALHANSPRRDRGFATIDCTTLPEPILESELFGHQKGAFTGAVSSRPGLLESADGGTIFLDEIGELPPALQAKLLRVLQERQIRRLGTTEYRTLDIRVIAATNRNLSEEIRSGRFREDLYFRVNVIQIVVPPLRERTPDIAVLAQHFLKGFEAASPRRITGFSPEAIRALERHSWPGNIRELRNAVERAHSLAAGPILHPEDFPDSVAVSRSMLPAGVDPMSFRAAKKKLTDEFEKDYLEQLLARHGGHVTHAAAEAGMLRSAFQRLMAKHHLRSEDFR